jgi:TldD protein
MQDRMNGRMMGTSSTGNCRRESYASLPMVRMTNTFMRPGGEKQADMIASIPKGILALQFGSGEVDIASGNFVFSATEAYMIENGSVSYPIKGVTLIGNGPDVLKRIQMVGHDFALDLGVGSCGKDGQMVPVGVGQPSILISSMTVGGTQV